MATLMKDDAQVKAFDEVNSLLEQVSLLNERINSSSPMILGINKKKVIQIDDSYKDKIISVLKTQRNKCIKEIQSKTSRFRIGLNESEQFTISDKAIHDHKSKGMIDEKAPEPEPEIEEFDPVDQDEIQPLI